MTDHREALDVRISSTRAEARRCEEAGRSQELAVAQARCEELTFARRLLFGDEPHCPHYRHAYVGKNSRGVSVWACRNCGEPYPPGVALDIVESA